MIANLFLNKKKKKKEGKIPSTFVDLPIHCMGDRLA